MQDLLNFYPWVMVGFWISFYFVLHIFSRMCRLFYKEHVIFKLKEKKLCFKKVNKTALSGSFLPVLWFKKKKKKERRKKKTNPELYKPQCLAVSQNSSHIIVDCRSPSQDERLPRRNSIPELSGVSTWRRFVWLQTFRLALPFLFHSSGALIWAL